MTLQQMVVAAHVTVDVTQSAMVMVCVIQGSVHATTVGNRLYVPPPHAHGIATMQAHALMVNASVVSVNCTC